MVGPLDRGLVELQLEEVIFAEDRLVPANRLLGTLPVVGRNGTGYLARQTGRAADQPFAMLRDLRTVRSRTHVETLGPRLRYDLNQVVVTLEVLCQQDEVVTALVGLSLLVLQTTARHVDLAADDRLEIGLALQLRELLLASLDRILRSALAAKVVELALAVGRLLLVFAPHLLHVVEELLDAEHVAVIRHGDAGLPVRHRLVHEPLDAGLPVENRILRMYVKVYELRHDP